jgi:hypothetical protein
VDEAARQKYRARVRRDNPMSRPVGQYRVIEELLSRGAAFDADVARVVRSLGPDDFRAFLDVLTMLRAAQFKAVSSDGKDPDYQVWFAQLGKDLAAGQVKLSQRAAIDRMISLLGLSDKSVGVRQLDPVCPPATQRVPSGPDATVLAAVQPLFDSYSALQARIGVGTADESLDDGLSKLLAGYQELRQRQPEGGENWRYLQWWCASVRGAQARSAAIQGHTKDAVTWFREAAGEWDRIGESASRTDCLAMAAENALADGANVDEALEPLIQEVGPPETETGRQAQPTISRARSLVRLAQVYLQAGDHFDASARAEQSAATLEALGFADPVTCGAEGALSAWLEADPPEEMGVLAASRTQAMMAAVAENWTGILQVRMAVTPQITGPGRLPASDLLEQLADLTGQLGEEARQVTETVEREAAAFGMPVTLTAAQQQSIAEARITAQAEQADRLAQAVELNKLLDEFSTCEGTERLEALLRKVEALEARVLSGNLSGLASMATTVRVLHSDVLMWLGRLDEAAAVLAAAKGRLTGHRQLAEGTADPAEGHGDPAEGHGDPAEGHGELAEAERRSLLVTVIGRETAIEMSRQAKLETEHQDFSALSRLCGEGITEVELDRGKVNGPYLQDSYLRDRRRLYDWGVLAALKTSDEELMLARSELAKARGVLGWAVADRARATDVRADEAAFHERTAALARQDAGAPASSDRAEIAAERQVLWDRLMTARAQAARRLAPPTFSLVGLQASLAPGEAVISYYWLSRGTLLTVTIDATSVISERINLTDTQRKYLDGLVSSVGEIGDDEAVWLEDDLPGLGELLLPQKGRGLLAGKDRLIVSPHRVLHQLPFHAFSLERRPLTEQFAISYVPNLTSLLLPAPAPRPPRVFALGVSTFGPSLRSLANTGAEAAAVAELYSRAGVPTTLLLDGQATAASIEELRERGTLAGFTTLHLATHGDDIPPAAPFDAALYLPAGKIDGLEISQWRLNADLVVLSACYSARRAISGRHAAARAAAPAGSGDGGELFGDEVLGLQAAFFAAGTRQILGTLWPASDVSAPAFMQSFHQGLSDGLTADRALSKAMNDLRGTHSMYHWAPYKLVRLGSVTPPAAGRTDHTT